MGCNCGKGARRARNGHMTFSQTIDHPTPRPNTGWEDNGWEYPVGTSGDEPVYKNPECAEFSPEPMRFAVRRGVMKDYETALQAARSFSEMDGVVCVLDYANAEGGTETMMYIGNSNGRKPVIVTTEAMDEVSKMPVTVLGAEVGLADGLKRLYDNTATTDYVKTVAREKTEGARKSYEDAVRGTVDIIMNDGSDGSAYSRMAEAAAVRREIGGIIGAGDAPFTDYPDIIRRRLGGR